MMSGAALPPGFRFHPTDEELIGYYLERKVQGLEIELDVIPAIDLYKFDPWELPEKSYLPLRDMEWFFFCPRDRKYPNGSRTNRATKTGYWKATGKDRKFVCRSSVTGYRKTLVFYRGRAPLGDRTDWVMHEYRLCDNGQSKGSQRFQGAFALCRIIKKNEPGLKMSANQGEWTTMRSGSCSRNDFTSIGCPNESIIISPEMSSQTSYMCNDSHHSSPAASPYTVSQMAGLQPAPMEPNSSSLWVSPDFILDSSKEYSQGQAVADYFPQCEFPSSGAPWQSNQLVETSTSLSFSDFSSGVDCADDLTQFGSMSPYSENPYYMGYFGNGETAYEGYGQTSSIQFSEPF